MFDPGPPLVHNTGMTNRLLQVFVRTGFALTSKSAASRRIEQALANYMDLANRFDSRTGALPVRVPRMPGVDEDMREWSFFMILEHNTIVNRSIGAIVEALVEGREPSGFGTINPKTDVMPDPSADATRVAEFRASVLDYLERVSGLNPLRGTPTRQHPVFGEFNAHYWHCMFGFHLNLHYRQAKRVMKVACLPSSDPRFTR